MEKEVSNISSSWLIIGTRDYNKEFDWYLHKGFGKCYSVLKREGKMALCEYHDIQSLVFMGLEITRDYLSEWRYC